MIPLVALSGRSMLLLREKHQNRIGGCAMFSSAVLDVVVGLIFVFMAVSLAASAILEAIAGIITWRSGALLKGIKDLLNDPHLNGLAGQLYQHALIDPRNDGTGTTQEQLRANAPAYIDPGQF